MQAPEQTNATMTVGLNIRELSADKQGSWNITHPELTHLVLRAFTQVAMWHERTWTKILMPKGEERLKFLSTQLLQNSLYEGVRNLIIILFLFITISTGSLLRRILSVPPLHSSGPSTPEWA
jgi:hypothetical protein